MRAQSPTCKGRASGAEEEPLQRMWRDHCACLRGHGGNLERGRATSSTDDALSEDVGKCLHFLSICSRDECFSKLSGCLLDLGDMMVNKTDFVLVLMGERDHQQVD